MEPSVSMCVCVHESNQRIGKTKKKSTNICEFVCPNELPRRIKQTEKQQKRKRKRKRKKQRQTKPTPTVHFSQFISSSSSSSSSSFLLSQGRAHRGHVFRRSKREVFLHVGPSLFVGVCQATGVVPVPSFPLGLLREQVARGVGGWVGG